MKKCKSLLALLLVCAMFLADVPTVAYASGLSEEQDVYTEDVSDEQTNAEDAAPADEPLGEDQDADAADTTVQSAAERSVQTADVSANVIEAEDGSVTNKDLLAQLKTLTGRDNLTGYFGIPVENAVRLYQSSSKKTIGVGLLDDSKVEIPAGDYQIQVYTKVSKWRYEWKDACECTVKNYYMLTFVVSGDDGKGGVMLNGEPVTAPVKCYYGTSQDAALKFTVNEVSNYLLKTVSVDGQELTPDAKGVYTLGSYTSAKTVNVEYEAQAGVKISAEESENGTIAINGKTSAQMVTFGSEYTVTVTPKSGYAVTAVKLNGIGVDAALVSYDTCTATVILTAPAETEEVSEILVSAEYAASKIALKENAEVPYHDGMAEEETEVLKERIFSAVVDAENCVPAGMTAEQVRIEYKAGLTWKALDYKPNRLESLAGYHAFGDDRTTETVRITYVGDDQYPSVSAEKKVQLVDDRIVTQTVVKEGITLKYNTQEAMDQVLENMLLQYVVVTDPEGQAIATKPEDFKYSYTRELGEQTLKVTYKGNKTYRSSEAEGIITIVKGDAKVTVKSQHITVGQNLAPIFACTPEEAKLIGLIAGIQSDGGVYVSLDAKSITLNDIAGADIPLIGDLSLQEAMNKLGYTDVRLGDLADIFEGIADMINQVMPGTDISNVVSGIQTAVDMLTKYVPGVDNMVISFGGVPSKAGVYTAVGVTVNNNYNTAIGAGVITISPKREDVKLVFDQEMPDGKISVKAAETFDFGGHLMDGNTAIDDLTHVKTLYTGRTAAGKAWISCEPCTEAGTYCETVFVVGGDYCAKPITRKYKVVRETVHILFETPDNGELTVPYDGNPHSVPAGVYDEAGNRICDASKVVYMAGHTYNSEEAPVNVGTYQVKASYDGDAIYGKVEAAYTRLIIEPKKVTVAVVDCEKEYGDDDPTFTYTVKDKDGYPLSAEEIAALGTISIARVNTSKDAGTYKLKIGVTDANPNYEILTKDGTLTISKRKVLVTIDSKSKVESENDPELTYSVSYAGAKIVAVLEGDDLGLELTRETGETPGLYDIYADVTNLNSNYELTEEPDGTDKFEILKKEDTSGGDGEEPSKPTPDPDGGEKPGPGEDNSGSGDGSEEKPNPDQNGQGSESEKTNTDLTQTTGVKTGDSAHAGLCIAAMLLAAAAMITAIFYRRKRNCR